jgi:hypothetical protein
MVPKIMLEGGHAWVHERPIAAGAAACLAACCYWEVGQPKVAASGADFGSVSITLGKGSGGWILHGFRMDFPSSDPFLDLRVGRNSSLKF